jgi:predicted site-specific integrase-resolvase
MAKDNTKKPASKYCTSKYWTTEEVCEYAQIHFNTLHKYRKRGLLPSFKIGLGNKLFFRPADVKELMKKRKEIVRG